MHRSAKLSAILLDIKPGDEVIIPSFIHFDGKCFCASWRCSGFVDIRGDTLNLNETLIEAAVTRGHVA